MAVLTPAPPEASRRVARNIASPFAAQLVVKVLGLASFALQAKLLTASAPGQPSPFDQYLFATIVLLYAATITDWGLGTWLTRELAARRGTADLPTVRRLFAETLGIRLLLAVLALLPLLVLAFSPPGAALLHLTPAGSVAIAVLAFSLLPSAFAGAVTALYNAYERMGPPAAVQVGSAISTTVIGVIALLLGGGAVGLAGAALLTTLGQAVVFYRLLRRDFFAPTVALNRATLRAVLGAAFPLMLNGLLITIFFRFDQIIIQTHFPDQVSIYEAAYKVINVTQIIAPSVVLALFPAMAHAALHDPAALVRHYRMAVKFLLVIGLPLVAGTVALADWAIRIITLDRHAFLPYSAWALAILMLYLPLSFINGVTQYVLIALGRQSRLTWAIGATAIFNLAVNLWAVPTFGIYGAAAVTVLSEIVLLVPFLAWTASGLGAGAVRPGPSGVRLAVAATGMALTMAGLFALGLGSLVALLGGAAVYAALIVALHILHTSEVARLRGLVRRT
ncbi:MAG: oligosaccharide flippase family protein [Chloroflexota bacterium]|nr:oligosaccharide flippase family protein [Chloroflexota bacterium]